MVSRIAAACGEGGFLRGTNTVLRTEEERVDEREICFLTFQETVCGGANVQYAPRIRLLTRTSSGDRTLRE